MKGNIYQDWLGCGHSLSWLVLCWLEIEWSEWICAILPFGQTWIRPREGYVVSDRDSGGKDKQIMRAARVWHMEPLSMVQALLPVEYLAWGKTLTTANPLNRLCGSLKAKCHCVQWLSYQVLQSAWPNWKSLTEDLQTFSISCELYSSNDYCHAVFIALSLIRLYKWTSIFKQELLSTWAILVKIDFDSVEIKGIVAGQWGLGKAQRVISSDGQLRVSYPLSDFITKITPVVDQ